MIFKLKDIVIKLAAILLIVCLMLPIGVKFDHLFCHHDTELSYSANDDHFQEIDLDCDCSDIKFNHFVIFEFVNYDILTVIQNHSLKTSYLDSSVSHKEPITTLRGPPILA